MKTFHRRNKNGGSIAFGVVLGLVLVIVGCGFLLIAMFMGGQTETKNATDAGALNVGKQALDAITVGIAPDDVFADCATNSTDPGGFPKLQPEINLRRINRVWAKALLMGINADAAQNDNGTAGSGPNNAKTAFQDASDISDALAQQLTDPNNLYGYFKDYAVANSVRMIGNKSKVTDFHSPNWQTSLMDRECESNISLSGAPPNFNLPPDYSLASSAFTKSTRNPIPSGAQNLYFLKGYTPITAVGKEFWQVPFLYDEKPHLVSKSDFDSNTQKANQLSWDNVLPNAFSAEGATAAANAGTGERAVSWMLTNPRQPFKLSIPRAFLKIHVDEMQTKWFYYPFPFPQPVENFPELTYGYTPDTQTPVPAVPGGVGCSSVTPDDILVGLDVVGRTLDGILFDPPNFDGNNSRIAAYITNRMNEMITEPGVQISTGQMHTALQNPATLAGLLAGETDFYVYSPDGKTIECGPQELLAARAPWLLPIINQSPDGSEHTYVSDDSSPAPILSFTAIVTPAPGFTPVPPAITTGTWDKDLAFTPGTGYDGCLGTVRVHRWTSVYTIAVCVPTVI